ncbi:hypothetical protein AcW1_007748 [Taiwanofungus camphoratus]|nr:hypothetical protein AcW1_007748 [Antrodia cinnamomea]
MSDAAGCRILVISSTIEQAQQFVQRIKALSANRTFDILSLDAASITTPWTIVNKYYTAEVHFEALVFQEFKARYAIGVPAVIYVWKHGESFKEHIPDISKSLEDQELEVSLAVRLGGTASTPDDEDGLDEFLSSHGFEFIEGDRDHRTPTQDDDRHSDDEDTGIPGLPRVIDALSTIMWPSMVQTDSTRNRKSRARELLGWAREEEEDDGLRALISDNVDTSGFSEELHSNADMKKSRMQREMEQLERWLEEEDGKREVEDAQAWVTSDREPASARWQDIPTTILTPADDERKAHGLRFDDDFADFVSAPWPHLPTAPYGTDSLRPMHTGASYRSLASVSDIAEGEFFMSGPDEDDNDPDLPSRTEIAETFRCIFGFPSPVPAAHISALSNSDQSLSSTDSTDVDLHSFEHRDDDDDFEPAAFDLSRVLSALQGMKEEISGMADEDERRKAAARVALGLVYGLQTDKVDEEVA